MENNPHKPRISFQDHGWKIFFRISILVNLGFSLLTLSVQPIWYDINKFINEATGLSLNWILIILLLVLGMTCLELYRFVYNFTSFLTEEKKKPKLGDKIRAEFFLIFSIALIFVLLSEMGNEIGLIAYGFRSLLPWILFGGVLAIILTLQPKLAPLWKQPLKIKSKAIGVNFLLGIMLISSVTYINDPQIYSRMMKTEPYLQITGENSMSIMWLTNRDCHS